MLRAFGGLLLGLFVLVSCGGSTSSSTPPSASVAASPSPTESAIPDPLASPSLSGAFPVDATGRKLAIECYEVGDPTIFLESGGPAIEEFHDQSRLVRELAAERRVCLYNRAGRPPSDEAPNEPREAEDAAADLHALVREAGIEPPFVLFGRSFGGMLVTFYASYYPDDVAGVVVYDSPAPSAEMTIEDFPEGVWDYPGNVEHLNVLTGYEHRFAETPVHFEAPLLVLSPTAGESDPEGMRYWLQTSPDATQIVLDGDDDVFETQAERVADEILKLASGGVE